MKTRKFVVCIYEIRVAGMLKYYGNEREKILCYAPKVL